MTKSEIIKRLEELDKLEFEYLMIDTWNAQERREYYEIVAEIRNLKMTLEEIEKGG